MPSYTTTPPPEAVPSSTYQAIPEYLQVASIPTAAPEIIQFLLNVHKTLNSIPPQTLFPRALTNALFSKLVEVCIYPHDTVTVEDVLEDERVQGILGDLRRDCSISEGLMEEFWARVMYLYGVVETEGEEKVSRAVRRDGWCDYDGDIDRCNVELRDAATALALGLRRKNQTFPEFQLRPVSPTLPSPSTIVFTNSHKRSTTAPSQDSNSIITPPLSPKPYHSPTGLDLLNLFPYYHNYVSLTRLELNAIYSVFCTDESSIKPKKFAFIGSGALPMTSICLAQALNSGVGVDSGVKIHNIDRDARAIEVSSMLCRKLGDLASCITFECASAPETINSTTIITSSTTISSSSSPKATSKLSSERLSDFDVVYLAALVGENTPEKQQIIESVVGRMRRGAVLVVRSAHSLRRVLYPVVEPVGLLRCGLGRLLVVHPYNDVVNSVVVARVERGC